MGSNNIDMRKVEKSISLEWQTAKDIKGKLELDINTQVLGKILSKMASGNPEIEHTMKNHVLAYRLKPNGVDSNHEKKEIKSAAEETADNTTVDTKPEVTTVEQAGIKKQLETLINDLVEEGLDAERICLNALMEVKEKHDRDKEFVKTNAAMFYSEYEKLKDTIKYLKNMLQDYRDKIDSFEMKRMVKSISEERRVNAGIMG